MQLALSKKDKFDSDESEIDIWLEIKSDPTSIGFNYLIGEEDIRFIAYFKKLKKVGLYFNCC